MGSIRRSRRSRRPKHELGSVGAVLLAALCLGCPQVESTDPSPGCKREQPAEGLRDEELDVAGQKRRYLLSVPEGQAADNPLPLVFVFHGRGGSPTGIRNNLAVEEAAGDEGVFVYPQGLAGYLEASPNASSWDLRPDGDDLLFYDSLLAELGDSHCIDRARVYATGFSLGGFMVNVLGCTRGESLAGIASLSGGGPAGTLPGTGGASVLPCEGGVPAWISHGSRDEVVDPARGEESRDTWIEENGCEEAATEAQGSEGCVAYQTCTQAMQWCPFEGEHEVPDFAAEAIWEFFRDATL